MPIYFGTDPLFAEIERFNTWIVTSEYWKQAGAEYGVFPGTRKPPHQFAPPESPIFDTQVAAWLDERVADGSLPKPSPNTVFALFYQADITVKTASGSSCRAFAALHESVEIDNPVFRGNIHFAIIPRCTYSPDDDPLMIVTDVASHEYLESATNPLPVESPAWVMDNASGPLEAWGMLSGPAVGDLCLNQSYHVVEGFTVQDIWSNVAARAGMNPCQPSDPTHPFFSVSAEQTIYHAGPGVTLTVHARAWSNRPTPDWKVSVNWGTLPYSDFDGQAQLNREDVNNGDELTATVTVPESPPSSNGRSLYRFTIDSIDPINPNFAHSWPVLIIVP